MFDSVTSVAMKSALDALSLRQRVIADNIANVNTPGFLAGRVQFEDALANAVRTGRDAGVEASVDRSLEPTRENGNNVNLDTETLANIDANLRYQVATRSIDGGFTAIRTALRSA
ncbi:flagellar basal-body rod protein FlgB [Georgenia satyanarayanai]|uniref:Flagellar basal body rod protein FlgB n=1 Tax=Georgenia satyanarayanai TaxID=860221 RepID=A0A2Y9A5Z1_9MICO|nr:flagellar basal body protein [Georgenia satyanarayanai]PYG01077.1 flagellar basal-body rod protein FlgB [Georgenia satyanarayanai]SSA39316.1 flagellar basal-body rod protein FlgB [Georgenia satyanarayanai]